METIGIGYIRFTAYNESGVFGLERLCKVHMGGGRLHTVAAKAFCGSLSYGLGYTVDDKNPASPQGP